MNYLGIDFGLRNFGFSIASTPLAEPLGEKKYKQLNEILEFTTTLINEKQIKAIVIGLPEGKLAENTKKFGEKLKLTTKLPVYYQDETLSTHQAKIKMIQAHKPQKKKRFDHKIAATIILQDYLDDLPKH